jgi:hypothetical protein
MYHVWVFDLTYISRTQMSNHKNDTMVVHFIKIEPGFSKLAYVEGHTKFQGA